jgi:hypothetical protein
MDGDGVLAVAEVFLAAGLAAVAGAAGASEPCYPALSAFSRLPASPLIALPMPFSGAAVVAARAAPRPYSAVACPRAVPAMASHNENKTERHTINRAIPPTLRQYGMALRPRHPLPKVSAFADRFSRAPSRQPARIDLLCVLVLTPGRGATSMSFWCRSWWPRVLWAPL